MLYKFKCLSKMAVAAALIGSQALVPSIAQDLEDDTSLILEELIVTANRREQGIQDVSGVIQAITGDQIKEGGITEFRQLQIAVPGLSIGNQEGNVEIFIRGVGSSNNTELGDPGAAPHVNGIYIPRPRGLGGFFYDLERVEVNKGPQGTLYGRNGLAGTLNIITKKPSFDNSDGYFEIGAASRDGFDIEGATNVKVNDNSAFRFSGFYKERDFGFNNVGQDGIDPAGLQEDFGVRLSYLNNFSDNTSLLVVADYSTEEGTGYPGADVSNAVSSTGLRPEDLELRDVRFRARTGELENEIFGVQATLTHDFGTGVQLEAIGSFRAVDYEQTNGPSDGINFDGVEQLELDNFSGNFWNTISDAFIGELRFSSNHDGALQWTAGAFGFVEDQEVLLFQTADRGFCCFSGLEFNFPDVNGESFALYGDATYAINDRTRLIGGLRYTDESKDRAGIGGGFALINGGDEFTCCLATRIGTEGFTPAGLDRPNFDVTGIDTLQEQAQFILEGIAQQGARDDLLTQLASVASGETATGQCVARPDNDNGFVVCPEDGLFSFQSLGIPSQQIGEVDNDFVDFRVGIEYDLSDNHLLYAKISSGTKASGFNDTFDGLAETFDSEDILAYEVGSRLTYQAFGYPAVFNATAFYYDYSDQVFQDLVCINFDTMGDGDCLGFSLLNRNIGESELFGLEIESKLNFANNFSLDVNAVFLDSEIISGVVADSREQDFGNGGITPLIDLAGNRLPRQSNFELSARLQQVFKLGNGNVDWQLLAKYRSSFFLTQFNERNLTSLDGTVRNAIEIGQATEQEAFLTVNAGIGYTFGDAGKYRLEAYGQNLTDEEASLSQIGGAGFDLRFLNDARTVGVRARVKF